MSQAAIEQMQKGITEMFIIWGFKKTTKELGFVGYYHCSRCNNDGNWQLMKIVSWFTLFFIPLIPYHTEYYVYCPICHSATRVSKEEAKQIMAKQQQMAQQASKQTAYQTTGTSNQ